MEEAREILQSLIAWPEAYSIDIFAPPDLKKAHELLQAGGMTLDAIGAHILRWASARAARDASRVIALLDKLEAQ